MLDTVLFARDKFLRPVTGLMLPDKAVLYMCAIEDGEYKADKVRTSCTSCMHITYVTYVHYVRYVCALRTCIMSVFWRKNGSMYQHMYTIRTLFLPSFPPLISSTYILLSLFTCLSSYLYHTLFLHGLPLKIDFWDSVYGFNMRVIKDIALSEPLVDLVESKAVVTNAAPILTLDIMTCKKEVCFVFCYVFFNI